MAAIIRGAESCCAPPKPRYGYVCGTCSVYHQRPPCGNPRPQPKTRPTPRCCYSSCGSRAPRPKPCCYDLPCKAECFDYPYIRPSGRYARTVVYPGECPPPVHCCQAFTCPNPPYHPNAYYNVNKHV